MKRLIGSIIILSIIALACFFGKHHTPGSSAPLQVTHPKISAQSAIPSRKLEPSHGTERHVGPPVLSIDDLESRTPEITPEQKARYEKRYGAFFRGRGLSEQQVDLALRLIAEKDAQRIDLQHSIREQQLDANSAGVAAMRDQIYLPFMKGLVSLVGTDGYRAYNNYEHASFYQQAFVSSIQSTLSAIGDPIDDSQASQLGQIIARNTVQVHDNSSDLGNEIGIDWVGVAEQAKGILDEQQLNMIRAKGKH